MPPGARRKSSPRGPGYLPKGGAPAAQVHNEHWRGAVVPVVAAEEVPQVAGGAPVRASVRGFLRWKWGRPSPTSLVLLASVLGDALLWWSR